MKRGITVSLNEQGHEALGRLQAAGASWESVIEDALIEAAARMSDREALVAELSTLATDPDDRAEMLAVTQLMEMLIVSR